MFKRYKGTFDQDGDTAVMEEAPRRSSPYTYDERPSPPRIFSQVEQENEPLEEKWESFAEDEVETILGESVEIKGTLKFHRCLRIDGSFEGELDSKGKLIVGPKGRIKSNLHLREAVIEGNIEGNITVSERIELRGEAVVHGNIVAKSISVDEGVTIVGQVSVRPQGVPEEN